MSAPMSINEDSGGESPIERQRGGVADGSVSIVRAVYKRRWLMLFVVGFLNVSNGAMWISFAPITNASASYFHESNSAINWLSVVFFVTTIADMLLVLYLVDRYGFKFGVQAGCALNLVGSVIRLMGTQTFIALEYRFTVTLVGQAVISLAQPFAMTLPTKVSEIWFPEHERTMATSFSSMGNPFGFMLGNLLAPALVSTPEDIPRMNVYFCGVGLVAGALGLTVRSARPPSPPSVTASHVTEVRNLRSYLTDLAKIVTNANFMMLTLAVGGGIGLVCAMQTLLGQTLCTWGYTPTFAGLCGALMVAGGLLGAAIFSFITSKRRCFDEIAKIGYGISVLITLALYMVIRIFRDVTYPIALLSIALGFFAIGIYPICLELGVETTYPIDEVISSGIIVVIGQIQGAIFVPVMSALGQPLNSEAEHIQKCTVDQATDALDMTYSGIFLTGIGAVWSILLIGFFRAQYNRLQADESTQDTAIKLNASPTHP